MSKTKKKRRKWRWCWCGVFSFKFQQTKHKYISIIFPFSSLSKITAGIRHIMDIMSSNSLVTVSLGDSEESPSETARAKNILESQHSSSFQTDFWIILLVLRALCGLVQSYFSDPQAQISFGTACLPEDLKVAPSDDTVKHKTCWTSLWQLGCSLLFHCLFNLVILYL